MEPTTSISTTRTLWLLQVLQTRIVKTEQSVILRATTHQYGWLQSGTEDGSMKKFEFVSEAAKRAYRDLPREIQIQFGGDLNAVQQEKEPFSAFKSLSATVGPGAIELIENGSPAYRAIYCCKYLDTVYVLHAFVKTTNGVDRKELSTAKARYKEMKQKVDAERKRVERPQ